MRFDIGEAWRPKSISRIDFELLIQRVKSALST